MALKSGRWFSVQRMGALIRKEFLQLLRDRPTLAMIVLIPIVQLILFGYAINTDPKNLATAVNIRDHSEISRSFISGLSNSGYFKIMYETNSDEEGGALLRKGLVYFVVTIPESFSEDLVRGRQADILIQADGADPTAILGASSSLQGIVRTLAQKEFKGPLAFLRTNDSPVNVIVQKLYNPEGFTRYNIIPGLMGIVLTLTGVVMTALALTRELERGTMENLLAMPVRPVEVMFGKIIPYVLIAYIQAVIIVVTAKMLFDIPILGSIPLLFGVLLAFITCNLSLGFCISALAKNQTQALQMSFMVILPSILLSGFLFPFYGMPEWAQSIGSVIPVTYFIRVARGIILKGADFHDIEASFKALLIIMTVVMSLAVKFYRKTID